MKKIFVIPEGISLPLFPGFAGVETRYGRVRWRGCLRCWFSFALDAPFSENAAESGKGPWSSPVWTQAVTHDIFAASGDSAAWTMGGIAQTVFEDAMITGTLLYTWLKGELVGTDTFSNHYYRSKGAPMAGRERRWVLCKGRAEASSVPPEWHAWLPHTTDAPLSEAAIQARSWQKEHAPNPSGTRDAYLPRGHAYKGGHRAAATGDYQAWSPDS